MKVKCFLLIGSILYMNLFVTERAGEHHLLPELQIFTLLGMDFVFGKIKLSTPVLQQEWEAFVLERGKTLDNKEIKLKSLLIF